MSKPIVHVVVPNTSEAACGTQGFSSNAVVREDVTCRMCKRSEYFRSLPNTRIKKKS